MKQLFILFLLAAIAATSIAQIPVVGKWKIQAVQFDNDGMISLKSKQDMIAGFAKQKAKLPPAENKELQAALENAIFDVAWQTMSKSFIEFRSNNSYVFNMPSPKLSEQPVLNNGTYTVDAKVRTITTINEKKEKIVMNYILKGNELTLTIPQEKSQRKFTLVFVKTK